MKHELKTLIAYFTEVWSGRKTFEVRRNDRGFAVGDILWLREYYGETGVYTGREILARVTYLLPGGGFGIQADHCIMSVLVTERKSSTPPHRLEALAVLASSPVVFGIDHRVPEIDQMLADGGSWKEIADKLGWDEASLVGFYERHKASK